ncbi:MAG TPA: hypothetical protein VF739_17290 [Ktedonobacterales bacterium]
MSEPSTGDADRTETGARALLLDPDLFFAVKVSATLRHVSLTTVTVRSAEEWARRLAVEPFAVTLVNISARGIDWAAAIRAARMAGAPVIAYGSHVETEAHAQARAAGATRVIANSKLAADLPGVVERVLRGAGQRPD